MSDQETENREVQEEERLALEAIYGPESIQADPESPDAYICTINVDQEDEAQVKSPRLLVLRFFLPATYPSTTPPVYQVSSVYCGPRRVDDEMLQTIEREFQSMFTPGQVVLFEWITWLRDYLEAEISPSPIEDEETPQRDDQDGLAEKMAEASLKEQENQHVSATKQSTVPAPPIYSSPEPLVDRKSVFVAHVAQVKSTDEVEAVMSKLLENKKIAKATHNIMAYRIVMPDGRMLQDNDDDGETAAGGRLLHMMQITDVRNVMVVVSRWYGGILLGADRFKDINNVARSALEDCGHIAEPAKGKRKK
ncbi:ribosomal protein S5 domain 2-type protein [Syncephalastrum racemosum]|uniref:Ribosomal protein S5 domain 2-type protein n=1 Tax=Syncephalastrum racemosum TaxID=13706 RepID=A0A1X2H1H1_SYNRA|nr:ribosomal protein S5 domain 2-type protein [Syncephalastrum racemosum]